jgi:hypothetical protein
MKSTFSGEFGLLNLSVEKGGQKKEKFGGFVVGKALTNGW